MGSLATMLEAADAEIAAIAAHLDALDAEARIGETRELGKRHLVRLWELAEKSPALDVDAFVAPSVKEGETVRFAGKNSLPTFANFEKHFARHEGGVFGFNLNWHGFASGWGYFAVDVAPARPGEVRFDYTRVAKAAPPGWPRPDSNRGPIARFIYKNQYDYNRRVARDVVIGFATILDKPRDAYYVLARKP